MGFFIDYFEERNVFYKSVNLVLTSSIVYTTNRNNNYLDVIIPSNMKRVIP